MAITLTSDYSKKLGLPGFSSHQFSVSIEMELIDLDRVPGEVARLYQLLQQSVDREIQQTGYVPGDGYGEASRALPSNGHNGYDAHDTRNTPNGHLPNGGDHRPEPAWQCSDKQRQLIADLSGELELSDEQVDERSLRLFNKPARRLDKLGASGLISDLLAEAGTRRQRKGRTNGTNGHGAPRGSQTGAHRNGGGAR